MNGWLQLRGIDSRAPGGDVVPHNASRGGRELRGTECSEGKRASMCQGCVECLGVVEGYFKELGCVSIAYFHTCLV